MKASEHAPRAIVFSTALGHVAALWHGRRLKRMTIGHASPPKAIAALDAPDATMGNPDAAQSRFVARLRAFAEGARDDFRDVAIDLGGLTGFQRRVVAQCRRIPPGQTLSYAELARRAGSPRAARAVGNVMRSNRLPLIVPCHRVVASGGGLGGYSAPQGLSLKRRLLLQEGAPLGES